MNKFLGIFAFIFSLIFTQVTFADSSVCREGMGKMVQSLNLDDAQKAKIKPILEQLKTNMSDTGTQMQALEKQLDQQANASSMETDTVFGLIDQKAKLIGDMMKAKITAKRQIFAVLNDQQKTQLQNKMQKLEAKIAAEFKSCHDDD